MFRKAVSILILVSLLVVCIPGDAEDYSWLDDLSINELRALDAEIHKRLPDESSEGQGEGEPSLETMVAYIKITDKSGNEQVFELGEVKKLADRNSVAFEANYLPSRNFNGAKIEMVGQISEIHGATDYDGHLMTSYITIGKLGKEQWIIDTSGYEELIGKLAVGEYIKVYGNLWSRFGSSFYVYKVNNSVVKLELVP